MTQSNTELAAKDVTPNITAMPAINSHNEWDTLEEVIVGSAEDLTIGLEFPARVSASDSIVEQAVNIARRTCPPWYQFEVQEDLEGLCRILRDFGAKVHRVKSYGSEKLFSTPDWSSTGNNIYNARDLHLVVGDKVITSPSPVRCRYFEHESFSHIWQKYFEQGKGFKWIIAPRPKLTGEYVVPYYRDGETILTEEDVKHRALSGGRTETYHRLLENEILFESACVSRMGKDLLYLVSNTGNYKGAKWLQRIVGDDYRVHTTTAYRSSHIDSTILPLRVGLVLLNSARVNPGNCPEIFKKWDKIYFEDAAPVPEDEISFQKDVRDVAYRELIELGVKSDLNHMSSPWAGLNVLSLDPNTVLVHDRQEKLISELKQHKMTVIPVRMRHCYTMLGGLHCSTLDTVRSGKLESYFD